MGQPWSAITEALTRPLQRRDRVEGLREAWLETAARLDLVRLGFVPNDAEGEVLFAYPCERAIARWRAAARVAEAGAPEEAEEVVVVERPSGRLIAGARRGRLASRGDLDEIARLCGVALQRDRDAAERDEQELRAQRGRAAAGAVHDLRNELSLALMYAQRATEEDAGPLREALAAARDLAHDALAHGSAALSLRRVELFPLIQKEAAAAIAAARRPDETSGPPRVRVRCSVERTALVDPRGFARALRNALTNAAEAALRRGPDREVRVEVRPLPETGGGALGADALRRGGYGLELEVADEGVGMSRAELARFLEPRLTARSAAHSTGFGTASLELGLTRSAVPLRVVSGRGRGTRVTFFLRSDRPAEVLLERDVRRAERRAGPGRAVVANEDAARALGARPAAT